MRRVAVHFAVIAMGCAGMPQPYQEYTRVAPAGFDNLGPTPEERARDYCAKANLYVNTLETGYTADISGRARHGHWIRFTCVPGGPTTGTASGDASWGRQREIEDGILRAMRLDPSLYHNGPNSKALWLASDTGPAPDLAGTEWAGDAWLDVGKELLTLRLRSDGALEVTSEPVYTGPAVSYYGLWRQKDRWLFFSYEGHADRRHTVWATFYQQGPELRGPVVTGGMLLVAPGEYTRGDYRGDLRLTRK